MIFTFYKARGMAVGSSLVEEDKLDLAKKLEEAAKSKGVEFILPTDVVIADKFDENANNKVVSASEIPDGWMVRVGPSQVCCMRGQKPLQVVSSDMDPLQGLMANSLAMWLVIPCSVKALP